MDNTEDIKKTLFRSQCSALEISKQIYFLKCTIPDYLRENTDLNENYMDGVGTILLKLFRQAERMRNDLAIAFNILDGTITSPTQGLLSKAPEEVKAKNEDLPKIEAIFLSNI